MEKDQWIISKDSIPHIFNITKNRIPGLEIVNDFHSFAPDFIRAT
jgi:hypothetical protein